MERGQCCRGNGNSSWSNVKVPMMVLSWSWKGTERTSLVACTFSMCRPPTCPATLTEVSQCNVTNLWVVFALHLQSALPSQRMHSALICCHLVLGICSSVFCHSNFSPVSCLSFLYFLKIGLSSLLSCVSVRWVQ